MIHLFKIWFYTIVVCFFGTSVFAQQVNLPIVPYPNYVILKEGKVDFSKGYHLSGNSNQQNVLISALKSLGISQKKSKKGLQINLIVDGKNQNIEGYEIIVNKGKVEIKAGQEQGLFYGIQSLKQLLMSDKMVSYMHIKDEPALKWRSFMLDEARHFQGKETVKRLMDDMALLKMNRFHWHLTNAAGWRIEIKSYPLLTVIGSRRDSTQINDQGKKSRSDKYRIEEHSGFYTQEEIREIIAYAAERHITIIPEITMPGHTVAAIASYPYLGVTKKQISVPAKFGVFKTVADVSDERTIKFFHDVLKEVSAIFPSEYIHIGGDEVKFDEWKESEAVNAYMVKKGIKNYYDLQVNFTNEISRFVADSLNKRIIGWNEILGKNVHEWSKDDNSSASLNKSAIVQFWKGAKEDLLYGIEKGHEVINSNHSFTYLDYDYKSISLKKAYEFNPIPDGLTAEQQKLIIGTGTQMWTEWVPTRKELEYQVYPRIAAYAECGWTNINNKDYTRFENSMSNLLAYWKNENYNLSDPAIYTNKQN